MNKIAIFGGSFNPVHKEHINIVKAAIDELSLDKAIIVPSCITPNKAGRLCISDRDRLEMCRQAFSGIDRTEVSDFELRRGGISYSYITCRAFKELYPDDEIYFIVGADMLKNFPYWKYPEKILDCVKLAVCARENAVELEKEVEEFKARFGYEVAVFGYVGAKISSTRIRTLAALGGNYADYLDKKTAEYIKERSLYFMPELSGVAKYLKPERWYHTLRVAVMAAENCSRIAVSEKTAITAAALHDCAKYLKEDSPELVGFTCPEKVPAPVVHQYAGAYVAEHIFGISDKLILDAIRYHSSGRENMTDLDKLLYLCDMLEEGRNFNGVEKLRAIFARSIDDCFYAALEHQLKYLNSTGEEIYPLTKRAFDYLKENKK